MSYDIMMIKLKANINISCNGLTDPNLRIRKVSELRFFFYQIPVGDIFLFFFIAKLSANLLIPAQLY